MSVAFLFNSRVYHLALDLLSKSCGAGVAAHLLWEAALDACCEIFTGHGISVAGFFIFRKEQDFYVSTSRSS